MRILTRASVFLAGWAVFFLVVVSSLAAAAPSDSASGAEADIGSGLLAFLLVAVGALLWGGYDGLRTDLPGLAVTWGCVGLLVGLLVPVFTAITASELHADVVATDVVSGMPFTALLVAGPALLGGVLCGYLRTRGRHGRTVR